jgi:micrococcal nuclease
MAIKLTKRNIKRITSLLVLIVALISLSGYVPVDTLTSSITKPATPGYYKVVNVSDGDTITVNMDGNDEKIRFIGVDTPETIKPNSPQECYGKEASEYLKNLLSGQEVKLEADPINQNRDRYNRLLRYVYFNDQLVNQQIIEQGYGFAYLSFPFSKAEEFRQAQVTARQAGKGVWSGNCQINSPDGDRPKSNEL